MAAFLMYLSHNKFKFLFILVSLIVIYQIFRLSPWSSSGNNYDIDHGPSPEGHIKPVEIAVYYEVLCPDSRNFIIQQLKPTVRRASRLVSTTFIPYGKAKTGEDDDGSLTFSCQHGPTECLGNKVHACGVKILETQQEQMEYVSCMIADNYDPLAIGKVCAHKVSLDWDAVQKCTIGAEGSQLLKRNGELTDALRPKASFIPTVLLDGGQWSQAAILKNLLKEVCSHFRELPEECKGVADRAS